MNRASSSAIPTFMDKNLFNERLQALDLTQVTITATIDPSGRLGSVGGLWPKLLAAAKDAAALGLLRAVVVAEKQPDVPEELEKENASTLRIIRAATLQGAALKLYKAHGPRAAVCRYVREQCGWIEIVDRLVPIKTHYQVLPLLREIERERRHLPLEQRAVDLPDETQRRWRIVDILRWEEEVQQERITYEEVPLDRLFGDFQRTVEEAESSVPRFVLLGPPGSGKTSFLKYLAWLTVEYRHRLIPALIQLRDWERWAVKMLDPNFSLPDYLAERYRQLNVTPTPASSQWQSWLQGGDVLLLLDGLDELSLRDRSFQYALKDTLRPFSRCPTVLTCRTINFEQYRAVCGDLPVLILGPMGNQQRDTYIRAFPAQHRNRFDPDTLIQQLNRSVQMFPLITSPLFLV